MKAHTTHMYQQVILGLAEEWPQIEALDKTLATLVADVRDIERGPALGAADWNADWHRIETLLLEVRDHAARTRSRLATSDDVSGDAIEEWKHIVPIEAELERLLAARKAANLTAPETRADWESCWLALGTYFATLCAHANSVQVKLELRQRFGKAKAAEVTAAILARLPEDLRDVPGSAAFQSAVEQLQTDRQEFKGVWDIMKALALWVETPEERARKIRGA